MRAIAALLLVAACGQQSTMKPCDAHYSAACDPGCPPSPELGRCDTPGKSCSYFEATIICSGGDWVFDCDQTACLDMSLVDLAQPSAVDLISDGG